MLQHPLSVKLSEKLGLRAALSYNNFLKIPYFPAPYPIASLAAWQSYAFFGFAATVCFPPSIKKYSLVSHGICAVCFFHFKSLDVSILTFSSKYKRYLRYFFKRYFINTYVTRITYSRISCLSSKAFFPSELSKTLKFAEAVLWVT